MRQFLFTGFNGFRQFGLYVDHKTSVFKAPEFVFNDAALNDSDAEKLLIVPSWRYTAFALADKLWLRGLLSHKPNELLSVKTPGQIKQLAVSERHCLVLLEGGQLYKLNADLNAALQEIVLEQPACNVRPQKRTIFGELKSTFNEFSIKIIHIACGPCITVAVSSDNHVYSVPSLIHKFQRHVHVRQLVCGIEHALLLTTNGDVYTWGNGLRGQLGQLDLRSEEMPVLLEALGGIKITHIAAGGWHSAAISSFGDLYTWGFNKNGQLGLRVFDLQTSDSLKSKAPTVFPLPQVLDLPDCCENDKQSLDSCTPTRVFAGARHTVLLMSCGKLWSTGWNAHGQLGIGYKEEFYDMFQLINEKNASTIVCGPWCTILLK